MPLIFFFFLRNSSYSSPPGPNMYLAAHTAQPGSLPRILQQTLHLGWGFRRFGPHAGPRDLIVLRHSSYRQIFQCPLSLVSDLHICWNTVGCSLCSSDQLGVSLVLRGSGLCSHLSRRHLDKIFIVISVLQQQRKHNSLPKQPFHYVTWSGTYRHSLQP